MLVSTLSRAKYSLFVLFIGLGLGSFSFADPITFDFTFTGVQNSALGVGYITFDEDLLPNPGATRFDLPHPAVLDLSITVTGSTLGDGTYGIADFSGVAWFTNGGLLDFSIELVGQPTNDDPWGTGDFGSGGDFNLFTPTGGGGSEDYYPANTPSGNRQLAPHGVWFFTLGAEGGMGDQMVLTSMRNRLAVPTMGTWAFSAMVVLLIVAAVFIRRRTL